MRKIDQNKEQKRRNIVSAAQSIFLSEGYVLASMDKIASKANVTKQTVYRYYPSKSELFRQSLYELGKKFDKSLLMHFRNNDTKQALNDFSIEFVNFHLSNEHLAIFRLLISESNKAPEIVEIFQSAGEDGLQDLLTVFFHERLGLKNCEELINLWLGMLLSLRSSMLIGRKRPTNEEIEKHVLASNELLLLAIESKIQKTH